MTTARLVALLRAALPYVYDAAKNYGPLEAKQLERDIEAALDATPPPPTDAPSDEELAAARKAAWCTHGWQTRPESLNLAASAPTGISSFQDPPRAEELREALQLARSVVAAATKNGEQ